MVTRHNYLVDGSVVGPTKCAICPVLSRHERSPTAEFIITKKPVVFGGAKQTVSQSSTQNKSPVKFKQLKIMSLLVLGPGQISFQPYCAYHHTYQMVKKI